MFRLSHRASEIRRGGSTTGSCSAARSTFLAVHLITQSVCVGLVKRVTYSLSEIPSTANADRVGPHRGRRL
jgi:hypothetical protein